MPYAPHEVTLFPHWTAAGYRYDVVYKGKTIVRRSRVPELDAARVLHARGLEGLCQVLDGRKGTVRMVVALNLASRLTVKEDRQVGPVFIKWHPMPTRILPAWRTARRKDAP